MAGDVVFDGCDIGAKTERNQESEEMKTGVRFAGGGMVGWASFKYPFISAHSLVAPSWMKEILHELIQRWSRAIPY